MAWYHRYSSEEIRVATGLKAAEIDAALKRFDIRPEHRSRRHDDRLLVLPYPGGRHPASASSEGAVAPRRDTKVSIFTPWDQSSYIVLDVPEAIVSNLGLLDLVHTHEGVPTAWQQRDIELEPREWARGEGGGLITERTLPNGIAFARVMLHRDHVAVEQWLTNGTDRPLTGLRVQTRILTEGRPRLHRAVG
jgi:hypothetical protein